jgi:caffeoyl-CoA O-methyltransferase
MKGTPMTEEIHRYICELFPAEDDFLRNLNAKAKEAEIPAIHISAEQLAFLQMFLKATGAKRILEVGGLAGYSAIGMARALPPDGILDTFELKPRHAEFIREQAQHAGLGDVIRVHQGDAKLLLQEWNPPYQYDFVFIDADKQGYVQYAERAIELTRIGGVVAGDNTMAWGEIAQADTTNKEVRALRAFNDFIAQHPRLQGSFVPVGDGMVCAVKIA